MLTHRTSTRPTRFQSKTGRLLRHLSQSPTHHVNQVKQLLNWDIPTFQQEAFNPGLPAKLPHLPSNLPPACHKWFIHNDTTPPQINSTFWKAHSSLLVPLEHTSTNPDTFTRSISPLSKLLSHLTNPQAHTSVYLAQHALSSLPASLQSDLPTPSLIQQSGRGEIYDSSLWLGRAPTSTPLHRDPNPNILLQLCGRKRMRMIPPEVGDALFEEMGAAAGDKRVRDEEMMVGTGREVLESVVWAEDGPWMRFVWEVQLGVGEAVFVPLGWWHSVIGIGEGVVASVNWWFR